MELNDGWDDMARSLDKDLGRAMAILAAGFIALGGAVAVGIDVLWHRHRQ